MTRPHTPDERDERRAERERAHWAAKYPETPFQRAMREKRERALERRLASWTPEKRQANAESSRAWWSTRKANRA